MRGDGQYARGFTILLYVLGSAFFLGAAVTIDPATLPAEGDTEAVALLLPAFACFILVVALFRSWELRGAWAATYVLCLLLFLLGPIGMFISWSWFRSLRKSEKPLTG